MATLESHVTTTVVGIVTLTMVPVPVSVYSKPAVQSQLTVPVYTPVPVSSLPYPFVGNSTIRAGPTGTAVSASAGAATGTTETFTGAANRMGMGVTGSIILAAGMMAVFI